jgi:hypothetical protein
VSLVFFPTPTGFICFPFARNFLRVLPVPDRTLLRYMSLYYLHNYLLIFD